MTPLQRRFKKIVQRFGEMFTVGAATGTGIFVPATYSQAGTYLTKAELDAASRPLRMAYVPYDDTTAASSLLTWAGLSLTVKRVVDVRFQGSTVAKLLVLA